MVADAEVVKQWTAALSEGLVSSMTMTWPDDPGPDEWYLKVVPEKQDENDGGKFNAVWIVLKSMAYPAHVCELAAVKLKDNVSFAWQFDLALKNAMVMVRKLNLEGFREESDPECETKCAQCGEPACSDDYLCAQCRSAE